MDEIEDWVGARGPGATVAPVVLPGFTDSRWFREAFPDCVAYGFFPQRAMDLFEAAPLVHGADERIPVEDLGFAARFYAAPGREDAGVSAEPRQAAARRHGAAQRPARTRPDPLGGRRADEATATIKVASGRKPRPRRPRSGARAGAARRGQARRGDGGDPAREARAARGEAADAGPAHAGSDGRHGAARPSAVRRAGPRTLGREAGVALISLAPALLALRGGDLAAYHGVEHKAIAAYEAGGRRPTPPRSTTAAAPTWSPRCSPPPRLGSVAVRKAGLRGPAAEAAVGARLDSHRGGGVRLVRAQLGHTPGEGAAAPRLRDPARDGNARALGRPARGGRGGAGGDPQGRERASRGFAGDRVAAERHVGKRQRRWLGEGRNAGRCRSFVTQRRVGGPNFSTLHRMAGQTREIARASVGAVWPNTDSTATNVTGTRRSPPFVARR